MNKYPFKGKILFNNSKRFLRIMRITLFFSFFCIFASYASTGFSQETTFTFRMESSSIKDVCKKIEKESSFIFIFSDNAEKLSEKRVDVTVNAKNITDILDQILSQTQLDYRIFNKQVVIYEKETDTSNRTLAVKNQTNTKDITQQRSPIIELTGVVVDIQDLPIPGVNIRLKSDKTIGTITNYEGYFRIIIPSKNDVLVFSFIGMANVEIPISPTMKTTLKITMQHQDVELEDVVVTGIFNKAKESYTGAATKITSAELQQAGNRSILSSVQNIDPSFNILQDITLGSNPNALPSITIRGSSSLTANVRDLQEDNKNMRSANQPLFIMDGFEISLSRFMDLDDNQVESVTLLKDNSATSLYGSRGANGVVVITTKRPKEGKLRVTYRGNMNIEAPDLSSYNLLNAQEKLEYEKSAGLYFTENANNEQELLDLYNMRKIDAERGVDTYWIKYPVRVGVGHKNSLRLEGGDKGIRYAAGLSYNDIQGAMKGSERKTFNGNVFLQYQYKGFIFQNDLQITQNKAKDSPYGTFQDFAKLNAYWMPYDEDGNLKKILEDFYYYSLNKRNRKYNPLYNALLPQRNDNKYQQITNNFSLEWRFNNDLFFRGSLSVTTQNSRSDMYVSAKNTRFEEYTGDDYNRKGRYTYGTGEYSSYEGSLTLNYSKLFADKHQLYLGAGYNIGEERSENYTIIAEGISNPNMDFLGMANQYYKNGSPSGSEGISRRVGAVFSGNYTYNNRYFLDVSTRGEGSSRFGSDKRFAPFWSTGVGWNMHHESFLKGNKTVNIARLRLSYGTSGSQNFSPYQALTTFRDYNSNNYRGWNGVYLLGLGNSDLGWQSTRQVNLGTEFDLFQHRFRLNVDVYNKTTDNLLSDINLPSSSGFNSYMANVGKILNQGFETTFNAILIRNKISNLTWSIGGSLIYNKNEIKEISNSLQFLNDQLRAQSNINPSFMFQEGESIYTIYAVKSKGIDPSNGLEIFEKQDGSETYTWDARDKVACGISQPKYQGNFNTSLRFKGITFNAIFAYRYGGQMYNYTLVSKVENILPNDNADKRVLYDRWKKPGDIAFFKSVKDRSTTNATSRFVMDENTLECRSLSLGYEVPSTWLKKNLFLEYLSITGYMEDLFYISSIKQERGLSYPYSKKFSFSITARF